MVRGAFRHGHEHVFPLQARPWLEKSGGGGDENLISIFGWILVVCFAWETLEHYLEIGLAGEAVMRWFQGVEFSGNRLVTDPLLIVLGAWLAMHYRWLNIPCKIFSFFWIAIHVLVLPDSMYLQRFFE